MIEVTDINADGTVDIDGASSSNDRFRYWQYN